MDPGIIAVKRAGDPMSAAGTKPAPPCVLVIFGAGGDLTKRLVMPALYNLAGAGLLDQGLKIIGVDHVANTDDGWRQALTETMRSFTEDKTGEFHPDAIDETAWEWISQRLHYVQGDFERPETYATLSGHVSGNAIFYLAVAARFFGPVVEGLAASGLLAEGETGFRRVIIEKPFGADLPSAQALNARILKLADESQYYRIDHFLGKETVQSILAMRFANGMFEPMWRREYIDHVEITAAETVGVEQRGGFYEPTGALRDMVPNHMFQLLSVVAMEPPDSLAAEAVRSEKAKLLQAVRPIQPADAVRGQYSAGRLLDREVVGYRQEPHVSPESRTETYLALKLTIDNWRWAGVPFYIRTGKRMASRKTEIGVYYKEAPYQMFRHTSVAGLAANVLRLQIDPVPGAKMQYNVKVPGPVMNIDAVHTTLRYGDFFAEKPNVGYETLIYDCMIGDATLFQRADNIEAGWMAVEPLLAAFARGEGTPELYSAGSEGPAGAEALLASGGHRWSSLAAE
jgi:glucose-6-phosphate 1-dehydrogenase